jgi:ABC-2 type transport system permease protein
MFSAICKLALKTLWWHPLPWLTLGVVALIFGLLTLLFLQNYFALIIPKFTDLSLAPGVTDAVITPLLMWSGFIGCFIIPLFAAKIVSEEASQNGDVVLFNSPLTFTHIVLGKLVALLSLILTYLLITAALPLTLTFSIELDWGKIAAGLLGAFLTITMAASISLYISSFTSSATLAIILSLLVLGVLMVLYIIGISQSSPSALFTYASMLAHFFEFLNGVVNSRDLAYFLICSIGLIGLNILRYRFSTQ